MRLLVTASRSWVNANFLWQRLHDQALLAYRIQTETGIAQTLTVVHGGARGGDRMVRDWVRGNNGWRPLTIVEEVHEADWRMGRQAGLWRDNHMINLGADRCLAFIHDFSRGASYTGTMAQMSGIETLIYRENHYGQLENLGHQDPGGVPARGGTVQAPDGAQPGPGPT